FRAPLLGFGERPPRRLRQWPLRIDGGARFGCVVRTVFVGHGRADRIETTGICNHHIAQRRRESSLRRLNPGFQEMNMIRTAMLLAFLTALFMAVGWLIGGSGGMVIAFLMAAGMNLFSYWNADKMVLSMHHAVEIDESNAPEFHAIVKDLADR